MAKLFQSLLFFLSRCAENQLRQQMEFLKAENEMLRKRVPKKRIFLTDDERNRLLKLGKSIGPGVCHLITIVHPRTYRQWISEKRACKPKKKMGRPKTLESIRETVIRIAKETGRGSGRILGELKKLRIRPIAQSTIKSLSQNRRGLAHFAESSEQNVPVPLSADGSGIGSKNILKDAGMLLRPKRGPGTWSEFLKMRAETLCLVN